MSDSWPAPPPADDASDSLAGQALEVERALKALEAVDAFRAEAAALRTELQALRASGTLAGRGPRRRTALRRGPALPEGAWRLAAECAVIVGAAVVAWAVHLGRVGILLTLGGTWLVVAVFEAVASRRTQATWVPPPPAAVAPPPVRAVAPPPAPAPAPPALPEPVPEEVGWPSRLEPVAAAPQPEPQSVEAAREPQLEPQREPEPESEPEAEPVVLLVEVEPDGGPSAGAVAVLEEVAELRGEDAALGRGRWWPRFRKREKSEFQEAALELEPPVEEPEPEPIQLVEQEPEDEPDGGPSLGAFAVLEEEAEQRGQEAAPPARRRWLLFGGRETPAGILEPEPLADEPEPEPEPIHLLEEEPEAEVREVAPAVALPEPEYGWPSRLEPVEEAQEPELELQPEPTPETEPEPEAEPVVFFAEVEPDGGPSVGAFAVLEEATEPRGQEAAPAARRRWLLFGRRETPARVLEPAPLAEEPEPEPIQLLEQEPEAEVFGVAPAVVPTTPESEYSGPSRFERTELSAHPEPEAEEGLLVEPRAAPHVGGWAVFEEEEELIERDAEAARRRRLFLQNRERLSGSEAALLEDEFVAEELESEPVPVLEAEPEAEPAEPEPEPLYAFSTVEPDGGPSVGAFALLEQVATLREQPVAEPPPPSRLRRLPFRRRRSRSRL